MGPVVPPESPVVPPERISLSGAQGSIRAGGNGRDGDLYLEDTTGLTRIWAGGKDMRLRLWDQDGTERVRLDPAKDADCVVAQSDGDDRSGVYGTNSSPSGFGIFGRNTHHRVYGFLGGQVQPHGPVPAGVVGQTYDEDGDDHADGVGVIGIGGEAGVLGIGFLDETGVVGESEDGIGVEGRCSNWESGYAGYFTGNVRCQNDLIVQDDLTVGGSKHSG